MRTAFYCAALILATVLATTIAQDKGAPQDGGATRPASASHEHGDMAAHMRKMNEQMVKHLGEGDAEYEKRFIDMMIPHHEGAILMAEHALKHAQKPELKALAKKIIEDQQKEIDQMRAHRERWYGEAKDR
jgi:uncharacterized protein (DUF305 family)